MLIVRANLTETPPKPQDLGNIIAGVNKIDKVLDCVEAVASQNPMSYFGLCFHYYKWTELFKQGEWDTRHGPEWKIRLQMRWQEITQDVYASRRKNVKNPMKKRLEWKYKIKIKGCGWDKVVEELEQNSERLAQK